MPPHVYMESEISLGWRPCLEEDGEGEREITKLTFRTSPSEKGIEKALVTKGSDSVPCCVSRSLIL